MIGRGSLLSSGFQPWLQPKIDLRRFDPLGFL